MPRRLRLRPLLLALCVLLALLALMPARPPAAVAALASPPAAPAQIVEEPEFELCPDAAIELATVAGTLRRDVPPHEQVVSVLLDEPAIITVLGYVKEGHPESCPGGANCGQGQLHEEIELLVGDELIGEHLDQGDVDAWFAAGPWSGAEQPAGETSVTIAHRMEGDTPESVSYKLTVCAEFTLGGPGDDAPPTINLFSLNEGAGSTAVREVLLSFAASDPAPSSGWGRVRFEELASTGGDVIAAGPSRLYFGGVLTDTVTLVGPAGPRPMRATICDLAGNCVSSETSISFSPPESVPPCVTGLTLDGGAPQTTTGVISISVAAEDPAPGSGVEAVRFAEYVYSGGAWTPTPASLTAPWQIYAPEAVYSWTLSDTPGLKYIQAWARDVAGNVSPSECARQASINRIGCGELPVGATSRTVIYRYTLTQDTAVDVELTSTSGDADLFIFPPGSPRPRWESTRTPPALDTVSFTAPVNGEYQIEVFRVSATARYCLGVSIDVPPPVPGGVPSSLAEQAAARPRLDSPSVDPASRPTLVWPLPNDTYQTVLLPLLTR